MQSIYASSSQRAFFSQGSQTFFRCSRTRSSKSKARVPPSSNLYAHTRAMNYSLPL